MDDSADLVVLNPIEKSRGLERQVGKERGRRPETRDNYILKLEHGMGERVGLLART
jgi:hypothetical protein